MNKLIVFSASWCGPCKAMAPHVEELQKEYPDRVIKYDIDAEVDLRNHYQIQAVPTLILVNDAGEEVGRRTGGLTKTGLEEYLNG